MGMSKSFTATVDRSPASIMILAPEAESLFSNNSGQPRRIIPKIYRHADVLDVQALNMNWAFWSNFPKDGQPAKGDGVHVVIVDPVRGAVTLPNDFGDDLIQALQQPYSVIVDRSSLGRLGVQVGDEAKMNGIRVSVRAVSDGYPSMFNASVFMSRQTAKLLHLLSDDQRVGPLVVKIKDPAQAQRVAAELNGDEQWSVQGLVAGRSVRRQPKIDAQGWGYQRYARICRRCRRLHRRRHHLADSAGRDSGQHQGICQPACARSLDGEPATNRHGTELVGGVRRVCCLPHCSRAGSGCWPRVLASPWISRYSWMFPSQSRCSSSPYCPVSYPSAFSKRASPRTYCDECARARGEGIEQGL